MRIFGLAVILFLAVTLSASAASVVRFAQFNTALTEDEAGALLERLKGGGDDRARLVAEVIQRVRPHVLLLQEIDRDADGEALALFADEYLAVSQNGAEPIRFDHVVYPPSNTGVPLGVDGDGDGEVGGPNDARGFGFHPGQYAFALLSRLPLGETRTFADLAWRTMPGNLMPSDYYPPAAMGILPLSSKTHLVVPVETAAGPITVIAAHPTPPVFDDARDWNGRRNSDEIRLIADIIDNASYLVDDDGVRGGLSVGTPFVVMGDLNADPARGDARPGAIAQLLNRDDIVRPAGVEGVATADFAGGLRVDYVLPAFRAGAVVQAGVVRFPPSHELARLNAASDHYLVYLDLVPGSAGARPNLTVTPLEWALRPPAERGSD